VVVAVGVPRREPDRGRARAPDERPAASLGRRLWPSTRRRGLKAPRKQAAVGFQDAERRRSAHQNRQEVARVAGVSSSATPRPGQKQRPVETLLGERPSAEPLGVCGERRVARLAALVESHDPGHDRQREQRGETSQQSVQAAARCGHPASIRARRRLLSVDAISGVGRQHDVCKHKRRALGKGRELRLQPEPARPRVDQMDNRSLDLVRRVDRADRERLAAGREAEVLDDALADPVRPAQRAATGDVIDADPDGRVFALGSQSGRVRLLDLQSGRVGVSPSASRATTERCGGST
jgi:hypothetical protein